MAIKTSVTKPIPQNAYEFLHVRSITFAASGDVNDVKFRASVTLRRYARGEIIGTNVLGQPIYYRHWMPEDQPGATLRIDLASIEDWAASQIKLGNMDGANAILTSLGAVEAGLAKVLEIEVPAEVGTVTSN